MQPIEFELRGEYIALDALLKATGLAGSGGSAKQAIAAGQVLVDGQVEVRRGCKLRAGQVVEATGTRVHVLAAPPERCAAPDGELPADEAPDAEGSIGAPQAGKVEPGSRMTQPGQAPSESALADWLGSQAHAQWQRLARLIDQAYPEVFTPEWRFGGGKHGWSLRYRKGSRSFCTLVPERNRCALLIVFGREERDGVEAMRNSLSASTRSEYDRATTFRDGKWLLLTIDGGEAASDAMRLLTVKRRPAHARGARRAARGPFARG